MAMSSQSRSVNRPLPSSPHWVPTITVPGTTTPLVAPRLSRVGSVVLRVSLELLVQRDRDDLPAGRAHLLAGEALDDGDGDRAGLDQPGVEQVAGQYAAEPVPELLQVDEDLLVRVVEQRGDVAVHVGQEGGQVAAGHPEGDLQVGQAHLVVGVEVVGRVEQRHHHGEAVLPEPDDLLHPAHLAVVAGVAAGPLAGGHPVLDDPAEHAGLDPPGPLALHRLHRVHDATAPVLGASDAGAAGAGGRHDTGGSGSVGVAAPMARSTRSASTAGATSWTRTIEAPWSRAQTTAARVPSSRCSTGSGAPGAPPATPMNPLRDGPTSTGTPAARATSPSRARRARLWATVLPNPSPGSAISSPSGMPASPAASRRPARKAPTSATTSS